MKNIGHFYAWILYAATCCLSHADQNWHLATSAIPWQIEGKISGPNDLSGAASIRDGLGIMVSDETRVAQPFRYDLKNSRISMETPVTLLAGGKKELDLEAVTAATDHSCYYATGSHSVARKSGKVEADRLHIFRIPVADATGEIVTKSIEVSTLLHVLKSEPQLADAIGKASADGGIDIEGLAEKNGVLYFGLRSPNLAAHAVIIEVEAAALFKNPETVTHRCHTLSLDAGLGIRDIATLRDGFIFIAGPSGSLETQSRFSLHHWTGPGGIVSKMGDLPTAIGKPEGLMLLTETATALQLLVLYDSAENGSPRLLDLTKPTAVAHP